MNMPYKKDAEKRKECRGRDAQKRENKENTEETKKVHAEKEIQKRAVRENV